MRHSDKGGNDFGDVFLSDKNRVLLMALQLIFLGFYHHTAPQKTPKTHPPGIKPIKTTHLHLTIKTSPIKNNLE